MSYANCGHCNKDLGEHSRRSYCSEKCKKEAAKLRTNSDYVPTCKRCGGERPRGHSPYCEPCRDLRRLESEVAKVMKFEEYRQSLGKGLIPLTTRTKGETRKARPTDVPDGYRWCQRCEEILPLSDFGKNPKKSGGCKQCTSLYGLAYRLMRKFGMTVEDYNALFIMQGGKCAICRRQPLKQRLAVDHNHKTGEVRGLLCYRCNHKLLGAANEDPQLLWRAATYLQCPPAIVGSMAHLRYDEDSMRIGTMQETLSMIQRDAEGPSVIISRKDRAPDDSYVVMTLDQLMDLTNGLNDASI